MEQTRHQLPFGRRVLVSLVMLVAAAAVPVTSAGSDPLLPGLPQFPEPPALPGTPLTPVPAVPAPQFAPAAGALFGAYVQGARHEPDAEETAVATRERDLGRSLAIDHHYYPWDDEFPTIRETRDVEHGRIPLISWNGTLSLGIDLGLQDELIRARADAIKAFGHPVFIRWMWEMDGRAKADDAVHPQLYIAAWRHIHDVFAQRGATNVAWVWCPNAFSFAEGGNGPSFYPGDDVVDWICADGYNWSPGRAGDDWRPFAQIFGPFYAWGVTHPKPLMVGEFGVQERGPGEKAQWVQETRTGLKTLFPEIRAVVYFDANKDYDWRMNTSDPAYGAFAEWARDPWFNPPRP